MAATALAAVVHGCGGGGEDGPSAGATDPEGGPRTEDAGDAGADAPGADGNVGDAADDADSGAIGSPTGTLSPSYVDFDVNHVLITGQSNAVSNGGSPPLAAAQPFTNLMFNTGVMPMTQCDDGNGCKAYQTPTSFVPLVEGDNFFDYTAALRLRHNQD